MNMNKLWSTSRRAPTLWPVVVNNSIVNRLNASSSVTALDCGSTTSLKRRLTFIRYDSCKEMNLQIKNRMANENIILLTKNVLDWVILLTKAKVPGTYVVIRLVCRPLILYNYDHSELADTD